MYTVHCTVTVKLECNYNNQNFSSYGLAPTNIVLYWYGTLLAPSQEMIHTKLYLAFWHHPCKLFRKIAVQPWSISQAVTGRYSVPIVRPFLLTQVQYVQYYYRVFRSALNFRKYKYHDIFHCHRSCLAIYLAIQLDRWQLLVTLSWYPTTTGSRAAIEEVWKQKPRQTVVVVLWGKIAAHMASTKTVQQTSWQKAFSVYCVCVHSTDC